MKTAISRLTFSMAVAAVSLLGIAQQASAVDAESATPASSAAVSAAAHASTAEAEDPISAQSATGYDVFGAFCYTFEGVSICVPGATLGHTIQGDGRRINLESAEISDNLTGSTAGGLYCNWRISWKYYDTDGKLYQTVPGPLHSECSGLTSTLGRNDRSGRTLAHDGRACAVFIVNGTQRARQCHSITS